MESERVLDKFSGMILGLASRPRTTVPISSPQKEEKRNVIAKDVCRD